MTCESLREPILSSTDNDDENPNDGEVITDAVREGADDIDGGKNPQDDEHRIARVVINPSMIDRSWNYDYFYFYDDVSVPYEALLRRAEAPLLPSQQKETFAAEEGTSAGSSQKFGHLWMRFCARLAKERAEFYEKQKVRFLGTWILWMFVVVLQIWELDKAQFCDSVADSAATVLFILAPMLLILYPLVTRFTDVTEAQVQFIVDDMAPLFFEEGFYVDFITSSPMYVRFQKPSSWKNSDIISSSPSSTPSLKDTMKRFQVLALGDHQETLIAKREEQLKNNRQPATIFGIPVTTLMPMKLCIQRFTAALGIWGIFFYGTTACLLLMNEVVVKL